jgi:ABC-2 type transport system ATP-binding protein
MAIIEAHQLTKRFRVPLKSPGLAGALKHLVRPRLTERVAVDSIDVSIEAGECIAYVGPNGAGKSTTVKMLTGVLVPSAGEVRVRGLIPHQRRRENNRSIGVVFGQRTQLWWDLPVQESLRLLGDIYRVPAERFARNLQSYIDLLDLEPLLRVPTRQLSLGQRMRCDLAAALIHSPEILYLDEPTIGLDVAVKARLRAFLRQLNRETGVTILLTSHDLGDIEELCDRMLMIDRGHIVFDGSIQQLKSRYGRSRAIHMVLRQMPAVSQAWLHHELQAVGPCELQLDDHRLTVSFQPAHVSAGALIERLLPHVSAADVQIDEPSVEAILRELYEGNLG